MDGFWLLDMEGHLLEVNDTYCRMSGYCRSDLLEKSVGDLDIIKLPGETAAYVRRIIEKGEDRFESRHRCHDGSLMDVEVSVQYRPDEEGRLVAFLRDISERKRAEAETSRTEAELQHSRKIESMGRLAGGVAHDFNNKLSIILGNVGLALAAARPDDPIVERLCEIQEAAEYSAALTRQLLGFARR
jgi:PAS domain S-box-containing protein